MKDAKGYGSNARGGVSSQVNAVNEWIKSIRGVVGRHADQPSVGTEPPTHNNLDAEFAGRNAAQRQQREIDAQSTPKLSDVRGNPGGTGTEEEWADIKHEHYKDATR